MGEVEVSDSKDETAGMLQSTCRQAVYLWTGLLLSMALFYGQSQIVFITGEPLGSSAMEWPLVVLGAFTFLMGIFFFKNYTALRKTALMKASLKDRKQVLLIAFVYQFVLFETLGLYGVVLSVLTQTPQKALPFIGFAVLGFLLAFPKKQKVSPFFS